MKTLLIALIASALLVAATAGQSPAGIALGATAFVAVLAGWTAADYQRNPDLDTANNALAASSRFPRPCAVNSACQQLSELGTAKKSAAQNAIRFRL